jgi:hypothetical protein
VVEGSAGLWLRLDHDALVQTDSQNDEQQDKNDYRDNDAFVSRHAADSDDGQFICFSMPPTANRILADF